MINLTKFKAHIKNNEQSNDTNLKRMNAINERDMINTQEQMKKIDKLMKKGDEEIKKLRNRLR